MITNTKKSAVVSFPLTGLKPLYVNSYGNKRKIIFEAEIKDLKKINEPSTIDEMVAEDRLEYTLGKSKTFTSAKALIKELHS
ncbi:hypothetical protein HY061_01170 [Candidatus Azambacteria bacterium]|nr:hypothetical protein [Candidatus Azambacteria bacterium]